MFPKNKTLIIINQLFVKQILLWCQKSRVCWLAQWRHRGCGKSCELCTSEDENTTCGFFFKKISSVLTPNFHPTQALRRVEEQWRTCSDCLSLFYSSGTRELPSRTSFLLGSWSKAKHWNSRNPKGVNNRSCLEVPKRWNMCSVI